MPDEKKLLDPAVEKIVDALAGMPDAPELSPPAPAMVKRRRNKELRLTIRWHHAPATSPTDPNSLYRSTNRE